MSQPGYPKYLQVDLDFFDIIDELVKTTNELKVIYFDPDLKLQDAKGLFLRINKAVDGDFLILENFPMIRLDRIITINGKVGPAYEEYDAFANACLSCHAGYDPTSI